MAQGGGGARAGPGILVSWAPNRVRGRCVCAVALHLQNALQKALPTSLEQTHSRRFQGLILCCFRIWSNPVCAHTTEMIPLGSMHRWAAAEFKRSSSTAPRRSRPRRYYRVRQPGRSTLSRERCRRRRRCRPGALKPPPAVNFVTRCCNERTGI